MSATGQHAPVASRVPKNSAAPSATAAAASPPLPDASAAAGGAGEGAGAGWLAGGAASAGACCSSSSGDELDARATTTRCAAGLASCCLGESDAVGVRCAGRALTVTAPSSLATLPTTTAALMAGKLWKSTDAVPAAAPAIRTTLDDGLCQGVGPLLLGRSAWCEMHWAAARCNSILLSLRQQAGW